jgi:hypothetical protein
MEKEATTMSGGTAAQTPNANPNPEALELCVNTTPSDSAATPPSTNPNSEIMENQTTPPSGGTAAQATNTNPNPEAIEQPISETPSSSVTTPPVIDSTLNHPAEPDLKNPNCSGGTTASLKQNAEIYQCAASSLKHNVKSGKLPATQAGPTAPYMANTVDVERLLRDTPGIASVFHPKRGTPKDRKLADVCTQPTPAICHAALHTADPITMQVQSAEGLPAPQAVPIVPASKTTQAQSPVAQVAQPPDAKGRSETSSTKRRRRRRGKGGGLGKSHPLVAVQPFILKALDGTTPAERLRIMACLNELAGLVASA